MDKTDPLSSGTDRHQTTEERLSTRVQCPACSGSGLVPRVSLSAKPPSDDERAPITCHVHPRYKAIRKPRPGCVLCHAMWQDKLVAAERAKKIDDANKAAYHGDIDGDFNY